MSITAIETNIYVQVHLDQSTPRGITLAEALSTAYPNLCQTHCRRAMENGAVKRIVETFEGGLDDCDQCEMRGGW